MASVYMRWKMAFERFGVKGTWDRCFAMGQLKFGRFVGEDHLGNKYYEDMDEYHGQHRWVEYKDLWNFDATMVPPSWHGWLCHVFDEPGDKFEQFIENKLADKIELNNNDNSIYDTHVALNASGWKPGVMHNESQMKLRGYNVGNLHLGTYTKKGYSEAGPNDKETYYRQPGHAASEIDLSFKRMKGYEPFTPPTEENPNPKQKMTGPQPLRDPGLPEL